VVEAQAGDAGGMFKLGRMYESGRGVAQDLQRARLKARQTACRNSSV
jgi:TPR repeat protein